MDYLSMIAGLGRPKKECSLCLLFREGQLLLGIKKRKLGAGLYNAPGGGVEQDETPEQSAIRETHEELGIAVDSVKKAGELDFYFPHKPEWNQTVHVFIAEKWTGDANETEELLPEWFSISQLPYSRMWPADAIWLPKVLAGSFARMCFVYEDGKVAFSAEIDEGLD